MAARQFDTVIKVGGSLTRQPALRQWAVAWGQLAATYRLLFVPGGGDFADAVRAADARFQLGDSAAHWMAILAMEQTAHLLAHLIPGAVPVCEPTSAGQAAVWAPFDLLRQLDPLPHSWQVTSDSIAAWVAGHLGIRQLVLLKSVAGVPGEASPLPQPRVPVAQAAATGVVDGYFPQVLSAGTSCWLIDGRQPDRLAELLQTGTTAGTRLVS